MRFDTDRFDGGTRREKDPGRSVNKWEGKKKAEYNCM